MDGNRRMSVTPVVRFAEDAFLSDQTRGNYLQRYALYDTLLCAHVDKILGCTD